MTAHVSKEQLGLMLPGTMSHYDQNEPDYLEAHRPGLLAGLYATVSGWVSRQGAMEEVASLTDAQLADIGISRSEVPMVFDDAFAARRNQDRSIATLQAGRVAGF
jgi:uncharacterized protein YjiS (DUF1127 family)